MSTPEYANTAGGSMTIKLTVCVPSKDVFDAYWYGYGQVESVEETEDGRIKVVVDYGDDRYHADYQDGRFASGLYFATVTDEESS